MNRPDEPPRAKAQSGPGFADVHIEAATPEAARQVAETLRRVFSTTEHPESPGSPDAPHSSDDSGGSREDVIRVRLTVDTVRTPEISEHFRPWLVSGGRTRGRESRTGTGPEQAADARTAGALDEAETTDST